MESEQALNFKNFEIWTHELTKVYGRGNKSVKAVKGINFGMNPGIHGFLGPNGAGKTSTINMLIGAISITKGEAKIRGKEAGSVEARKLIGFLPQDPAFYDYMIGEDYLIFKAQLSGMHKKEAKEKASKLLKYFEMDAAKARKIGKYSGGEKQKIGLAASFIHNPEILILDEPTANLDPIGRGNLIKLIKELSKDMSIFVSSHVLSEIEQMCDIVTIINKGEIIITDSIKNIKNIYSKTTNLHILDTSSNEKIIQDIEKLDYISRVWIDDKEKRIYIDSEDTEKLQEIIPTLLVKNRVLLKSFYQPESSLQDIFIELMKEDDS